jgi:hypothetical protein
MIIKHIENYNITDADIELYKTKTSKLKGFSFTANDVGIDARIISIHMPNAEPLVLVNPVYTDKSNQRIVYFEPDSHKSTKIRKTVRHRTVTIQTDNLGLVEFKPTNEKQLWETTSDFFQDMGLLESVLVQRSIDAINGIDITHKDVLYVETVKSEKKYGRNDKVMLQSINGETVFVKYKKADTYINQGYVIV